MANAVIKSVVAAVPKNSVGVSKKRSSAALSVASISVATTATRRPANSNPDEQSENNSGSNDDNSANGGRVVEKLPGESQADYIRRRDTIYHRRTAEKKRRIVTDTEQRVASLKASNQALRQDNERLVMFLGVAHMLVSVHLNASGGKA